MRIEQVPAYELVLTQDIPDIHSKGYLLKHKKSGARVMLLENDDDNQIFMKKKKFSVRKAGTMNWKRKTGRLR